MVLWNILSLIIIAFVAVMHVRQMAKFTSLAKEFYRRRTHFHPKQAFTELLEFSKAYYEFSPAMQEKVAEIRDPFLRDSVGAFLHGGIVGHDLLRGLRQKADQKFESDIAILHDIHFVMRSLPALGWAVAIGSTIWMFNTGGGPITFERAASAFSMTLAAVFYGLGLTYMVAMPLMERIWRSARDERNKNCMIVEGLGHLIRKKSPFELYETIQVLLPDNIRPNFQQVFQEKLKAG